MATPSGRHVVGWLLAAGGLFTARFSPDPVVQAHDLGRRDLAQDLFLQLMDVCPGSYVQMITEQKERHERHRVDGDEYAD